MEPCLSTAQVQLWGGVECTVNRIGDQYFNQLDVSGHSSRLEDLELFADLGIRVLRYPVLWEVTAPGGFDQARWCPRTSTRQAVTASPVRCAPSLPCPRVQG